MDITETENNFLITAELPGLDEKNVDLTLDDGTLTIKGEKKTEREDTQGEFYSRERPYGAFQRTFEVPEIIDQNKIDASFINGVLTVTMPILPAILSPLTVLDPIVATLLERLRILITQMRRHLAALRGNRRHFRVNAQD